MSKSVCKRTTGALVLCLVASAARAEVSSTGTAGGDAPRAQAASLFERGVREFEAQDYASAARTFLEVDTLAPSDRALSNALAAARRAGRHLMVVEIVERSRGRSNLDPDARKLFERALVDASRNLARVEARCEPAPCAVQVDGTPLDGAGYVEPGEHVLVAESRFARDSRQLQCAAGATCVAEFVLDGPRAAPSHATRAPAGAGDSGPTAPPATRRPLPPWAFIAGAAATIGLAGVTVWSGFDTLAARDRHAPDAPSYDPDDIEGRARRTDFLLAGTAVLAGATAVVGLFFVDWNGQTRASAALVPGSGVLFTAAREF